MLIANKERSFTPYLRLPHRRADDEVVADFPGWMQYFVRHLRGYTRQVRMFIEEAIPALNVPEETPELFDRMFDRDPNWLLPMTTAMAEMQWRERARRRPAQEIEVCNLFVPKNAPGYDKMVSLANEGKLGSFATLGKADRPYYRFTPDGIRINLKDYLDHVRRPER